MATFYENFKFSIESVTPFPAPPENLFGTLAAAGATITALAKGLEEISRMGGLPKTMGQLWQHCRMGGNGAWLIVKNSRTMSAKGLGIQSNMVLRAGTHVAACAAAWYVGALVGACIYAGTCETSAGKALETGIVGGTQWYWDWYYGTNARNAETARMEEQLKQKRELQTLMNAKQRLQRYQFVGPSVPSR
jgi:hypothetical protein